MHLINYPFSADQNIQSGQKIKIILDCLLLSVHRIEMPKMRYNQAKKAVMYALEDELLQSMDEISVFVNKEADGSWSALAIEDKILDNIKDEIDKNAIDCLALVPEFMFLPVLEDKISYLQQEDLILFRISKFNGGKINKDLFFQMYEKHTLQTATLGEHHFGFNLLNINLWQKYGKQIKQFRTSMVFLALVFVLSLLSVFIENQQLSKQLTVKTTSNTALFKQIFPDIVRIVDLPVQLDDRLVQINRWKQSLKQDLLLAMSKHKFDSNTQRVEFINNKLRVLK